MRFEAALELLGPLHSDRKLYRDERKRRRSASKSSFHLLNFDHILLASLLSYRRVVQVQ